MNEQDISAFLRKEAEKCAEHLLLCMKMKIDSMNKVAGWTPCNVALPTKSGRYMVTIKNKGKRRTEMRNFDLESKSWESERYVKDNIIAWQERPAPYVPEE